MQGSKVAFYYYHSSLYEYRTTLHENSHRKDFTHPIMFFDTNNSQYQKKGKEEEDLSFEIQFL